MNRNQYELYHYGVKGMKWGVRRYQNKDGSLTPKGKQRQSQRDSDISSLKKSAALARKDAARNDKALSDLNKNGFNSRHYKDAFGKDGLTDEGLRPTYKNRKEALNDLKKDTELFSKNLRTYADTYDRMASKIKSTPIGKKTYLDVKRSRDKIVTGMERTGTLLGTAGSVAIAAWTKEPKIAAYGAAGSAFVSYMVGSQFRLSDSAAYYKTYKEKLPKSGPTRY